MPHKKIPLSGGLDHQCIQETFSVLSHKTVENSAPQSHERKLCLLYQPQPINQILLLAFSALLKLYCLYELHGVAKLQKLPTWLCDYYMTVVSKV